MIDADAPVTAQEPLQAPEPMAPPEPSPEQLAALEAAQRDYAQAQAYVETQHETATVIRNAARLAQQVAHENLRAAVDGRCTGPGCHRAEDALHEAVRYLKRLPDSGPVVAELTGIVADSRKQARDYQRKLVEAQSRVAQPHRPPPPPQPSVETIFQQAYERAWRDFQRQQAEAPMPTPRPLL